MEPASPSAALIELTLTPATDSDRERLEHGLRVLTAEDPTLHSTMDPASGISTIGALGEMHLEIVIDRLSREFHVSAGLTKPRVVYKEARFAQMTVLLEPVMRVEVVVPKDYIGDVMGDLASRRGRIQSQDERGGTQIVNARVPLSEMFGYATDLRSRTQGRATYSMHFDRYEQAPNHISDEVVKGK